MSLIIRLPYIVLIFGLDILIILKLAPFLFITIVTFRMLGSLTLSPLFLDTCLLLLDIPSFTIYSYSILPSP